MYAPRRCLQFSIREIALCVVAIGLTLCWFHERQVAMPIREAARLLGLPKGAQGHIDVWTWRQVISGVEVEVIIQEFPPDSQDGTP